MRAERRLWVGTYPEGGNGAPAGRGEGVWAVELDLHARKLREPRLVAELPAPSFLVQHPSGRMLYALSETTPGAVHTLPVDDDGRLGAARTVPSGGDGPCHLLLTERALYVAHYSDGTLAVHPVDDDGVLVGDGPTQVLEPGMAAGATSRAHFVALTPGGGHLLVCDLGLDVLRRYRIGHHGRLTDDGVAARLPTGTGPRHLAFGPDGLLHVAGELDGTLSTLTWDQRAAEATVVAAVDLAPAGGELAYPAHVVSDERGVHVSVRGPDEIVTMPAVGGAGQLHRQSAGGAWPRHFAVVDGLFVVAGERSHQLVLLAPDGARLDDVGVPDPACVLPGA